MRSYFLSRNRAPKAPGFAFTNGVHITSINGFPKSGTSGTLVDSNGESIPPGSIVYAYDSTSKMSTVFCNEGSVESPYYTPVGFEQRGLWGWYSDFTRGYSVDSPLTAATPDTFTESIGTGIADTRASKTIAGGLRIHGQGAEQDDTGLTIAMSDQGAIASLISTNEDAHISVLSVGNGTTPVYQPDQNGTIVLDATVAVASLTASAAFVGFCGSAADALDPIMTYATTTISFAATIGDDVAGFAYSSELTDNDKWFFPHDKGNTNASIATTATGVDTGVDVVAGAYNRLRVEVDADGEVRAFIDKVLISTFSACLDADEEIQPMVYIESSTTATKTLTIKQFMTWGKRPY